MTANRLIFYSVAIVIIALLLGLILPAMRHVKIDSNRPLFVAKIEMSGIGMALNQFKSTYGKFPAGDNSAVFQTLFGLNPKQIRFLYPGKTNAAGEMLDPWKLPYKIEIISQTNFVVRSGGKNQIIGDADDYIFSSDKHDFVQEP
jgi:hypothetical protein